MCKVKNSASNHILWLKSFLMLTFGVALFFVVKFGNSFFDLFDPSFPFSKQIGHTQSCYKRDFPYCPSQGVSYEILFVRLSTITFFFVY